MAQSNKFTKYTLDTSLSPAFRALSVYAKALYPQIKLEWRPVPYNNNGEIQFTVSQAADFLGCHKETARKALHDLQRKGFLQISEIANLGPIGKAKGHFYEITELALPNAKFPTEIYLGWNPNDEFKVVKAQTNNPKGHNGKKGIPTYLVGSPNLPRMLKGQNPNLSGKPITRKLKENHPIPNLRDRSPLDNRKEKHYIHGNKELTLRLFYSGRGLCGMDVVR